MFRTITCELKTLSDVVKVIEQVAELKGVCKGARQGQSGKVSFWCDQKHADARKVAVWLDGIDHPKYDDQLGVFFRIHRYLGSLMDHITVWVPLGITVTDVVSE